MKFEDLFKHYMGGDNPEDNIYDPDVDPDDELDEEDDDKSNGNKSNAGSEDSYDDYQDYNEYGNEDGDGETEEKDQKNDDENEYDTDNSNNRDRNDRNKKKEKSDDTTKTEAGKDQENLDNVDKNLDEKDTENRLKDVKENEADGSKGHTSSDTGAQNPLQEADAGRLGNEGPQGKGPGDSPTGAGDSPKGAGDSPKGGGDSPKGGGPKGGAGDSPTGGALKGGAEKEAGKKAAQETGKKAAQETGKKAAQETGKKAVETSAKVGADLGVKAGSTAAANGAGGGGLISLIGATVPWSLIVIAVIVIIIIIIIVISFFQTLPGSMLENLKTSVKKWFSNFFAEVAESLGFSDNTLRVNEDDVNRLAQYINDMGYDIQTYGFGDIIVKSEDKDKEGQRDDRAANGVDKKVEDDGETDEIKCKSKYLKAYLAADECTYHFRSFNILNTLFSSSSAQLGLIEVKDDGGLLNQYRDKLKIDREHEDLIVYNNSLDIPVIGWFKKLFTGTRAFQWGEMFRYDLNTWIGRYKRPVELFLAIHLSTMMPDLTYRIATEQRFNTEVDVRFEPIKLAIRGNLSDNSAYVTLNGEKKSVRDILYDYLSCFECGRGIFESSETFEDDQYEWAALFNENTPVATLWEIFETLYDKYDDIETIFNELWNYIVDFKYIKIDDSSQVLMESVPGWFDHEVTFNSNFYAEFGCTHSTLGHSNSFSGSPDEFSLSDLEDMIEEYNKNHEGEDGFSPIAEDTYNDSDKYYIQSKSEWYKIKLKDDSEKTQEKMTLAYILYKFGTEDLLQSGDAGMSGVLWPFVEQVKNHWYYNNIDFLGTSVDNATYRLAKVGYKTIEYKNEVDGVQYNMQIPSALYPDQSNHWDFIVYQVAEPVTEGCNTAIKEVFSGEYYRFDGTVEKAKMIANSRAIDDGKSTYYYGGTDYDVEDKDGSKAVKEVVSMPNSPEQTLQSLAILKNMHSVASDYIYRDLKELYVKLEYYSQEQMTEDLTLMWLWPIKVENKNASFDLVETHDKFGRSIVAWQNAEVLSPCDGTLAKEDDSYEITVTSLNEEAEKLLKYIFRNDYYNINKTKLNGLKIRLDGLTLDSSVHVGDTLKRGQTLGKVNNAAGKLNVTIRFADKTVVDDMTEYMREDHNNKYEEIMKRRMETEEGSLPPIPLRAIFGYDLDGASTSISEYSRDRSDVTVTELHKKIYAGLKDNFSDEQIAGMMGNIQHESSFILNNLEDGYATGWGVSDSEYTTAADNGTWVSTYFVDGDYSSEGGQDFVWDHAGYGLCQWTSSDRKEDLPIKRDQHGASTIADADVQIELLRDEASGRLNGVWDGYATKRRDFESCTSGTGENGVMIATKAFCYGFEKPGQPEKSMQSRISAALAYYDEIKAGHMDL